jgi:hypothetical protein
MIVWIRYKVKEVKIKVMIKIVYIKMKREIKKSINN